MSTRSTIWVKTKDGYKGSYVHFDGYPGGVGETLTNYYNDEDSANKLINLGSVSSISNTLLESVFYCRDRKENISNYFIKDLKNINQYKEEYTYVFDEEWKRV